MLPPDYFYGKNDRMIELYEQLQIFILKDISHRLLSAGEMTATADRLIWKLQQMGESRRAIENKLSRLTGLTRYELKKILQEAVMVSWENDKESLEQWIRNNVVKSPLVNPAVIRVMDAEYKKSLGELENLTRTTMRQAGNDLINMLDEADLRVAAGVQSYSAAMCDILDRYAGRGIYVDYPIIEDRPTDLPEIMVQGYGGFLFRDKNGMSEMAMHWQHRFNHAVKRYNDIFKVQMPNITPHVCRHTYCSNMARARMNPKTLQYLMGHSDISVTMNTYTHLGFDDAKDEMVRLEAAKKEVEKVTGEKLISQKMFKAI